MSAAAEPPAPPTAATDLLETRDAALIRCEHDRATLARTGKPLGLVFEAIEHENT